jgi:hypothetical protein
VSGGGVLHEVARETFAAIGRAIAEHRADVRAIEIGDITWVTGGIARVRGLPGTGAEELVRFPTACSGSRPAWSRTASGSSCSVTALAFAPGPRRAARGA